jgi:hypothetical protein
VAAKDDLARYLTNVEEQTEPVDVAQVGERVEALLTELGLPWSIDEEADWEIKSDVGTVFARLEGGTVWIFQHVHELEEKSKKYADYFRSLLVLNGNVSGAAFAIFGGPGDTQWLSITSSIAATSLDKEELAFAFKSVFELARLWETTFR